MLNSDTHTEFFYLAEFQRFVQNSTLRTNETGRKVPLKCRGL